MRTRVANIKEEYRKYIESEKWKCSKSLNGSHYWIYDKEKMRCKFCRTAIEFGECKTIYDCLKVENVC